VRRRASRGGAGSFKVDDAPIAHDGPALVEVIADGELA
jgi:hypothetical protein